MVATKLWKGKMCRKLSDKCNSQEKIFKNNYFKLLSVFILYFSPKIINLLTFLGFFIQNWQKKTFCQQIKFYVQAEKIEKVLFAEKIKWQFIFSKKCSKKQRKKLLDEELRNKCTIGWVDFKKKLDNRLVLEHKLMLRKVYCQALHSLTLKSTSTLYFFLKALLDQNF